MNILSYNPGHDGSFAYLSDGHLILSYEAEKDSHFRHSSLSVPDVFNLLGEVEEIPDVLCKGGWWRSDAPESEQRLVAEYRGISGADIIVGQKKLIGKTVEYFSSSHERSHILCAFGMSNLPKGTPCYALLWEGVIGAFYEVDADLNVKKIADVMPEPGHRYALLYGIADPAFNKSAADYSRFSDAGKLMALASFATRDTPTDAEEKIISFLMQDCAHLKPKECEALEDSPHYNVGVEDPEFRNFAGIVSDRIFDRFLHFAEKNMKKKLPLLITGGCGLNCDWNTKWRSSNLFADIFVPPVANDSGSAIGTAIDAQFYFTGNPKVVWSVYSGIEFDAANGLDESLFDIRETSHATVAEMLAHGTIIGWVSGKAEIGPRALGNRSILAAPFKASTRVRLNEIKQREQFRPIAPVCLEEEAAKWFKCDQPSPHMLYTQLVTTDALAAVTHVNATARIQTVSDKTNSHLHGLLKAFKALTGYGVLCNTSLNFKGRGFINNIADLSRYSIQHGLDGFVVEGKSYMRKSSETYQAYLRVSKSAVG